MHSFSAQLRLSGALLGLGLTLAACSQQPPAGTAPPQPAAPPLPAPLQALLPTARIPFDSASARRDIRRLQAAGRWRSDSLARMLVHLRLANDYQQVPRLDSAYWHLLQAQRAAGPAPRRAQPAEAVLLARELAVYHWQQQNYDSARYYYAQGAARFTAAGLDSVRSGLPVEQQLLLTSGYHWAWGSELAGLCANAGLAHRQLGQLGAALPNYERAIALYQGQANQPGLVWTQCLLGKAYEEQGNDARAAQAFERALTTARAMLRTAPSAVGTFQGALDYYCRLLIRQGRQAYLEQLVGENLAAVEAAGHDPAADARELPLLRARLQLMVAGGRVQLAPSRAAQPLREAAGALAAVRRYFTPDQLTIVDYYQLRATWWALQAWQQPASRRAALLRRAIPTLDSARWPSQRELSRRELADFAVAMQQPAVATRLLAPLVRPYERHRRRLLLSQVYSLLSLAHAATGRFDSAYYYTRRHELLTDTLRAAQQYAALAAAETRYRTRVTEARLQQLTTQSEQQRRQTRWAWGTALLLGGLLTAVVLALRLARRRGQLLTAQRNQLQDQASHLAALDHAKNQFFANVSHELRTPLTLVLGPVETLLTSAAPLPNAVREPLAVALRHGQRLRELINRILELTKLQAGRLELHLAPVRLAPLLRRLVGQFEAAAAQRGLHLRFPTNVAEALQLRTDADKVEQVLTNLLANALNHTPPGGSITVTAACTEPDLCTLTVQDTGPGIAPAEQARVFERFYQSPQRQAQGGTGLGLALSRELAELLGGSLTLSSRLGEGTTFTFRLRAAQLPGADSAEGDARAEPQVPAADAGVGQPAQPLALRQTPLPMPAPPPAAMPGVPAEALARVLVVDDEADLRTYLRQLLAPHYHVLEAEDGRQALAVLAREAVDLLVVDSMMPHVSGIELLQTLKTDPERRGLPFLMLTARADDAHRLTALETGVDDYLTKPFAAAELLTRVQALLARYRVRQHFAALPAEVYSGVDDMLAPAPRPGAATPAAPDLLPQWRAVAALRLTDPDFGPADLAAALHLSERTLYRRLSELAGLTPAAWLRELRLDHARRLLESGAFGTVAEVAYAAGFANAKHFSTLFAQRYGRKPSEYRR
ncbi:response regulator [Hymenobacter sp. 15J16-1T3B]|uniref:ATP-binding protein n=1 Tax=Hymenobacter sp. 15J16-1T3B TaxID=2886941 RepID=UPI001D11D693|nr:ATP-binding protein [Hymenobacter sp. 15J16-1T3B]MCC3159830.1 response regulator [Hymenobacter sp. 15J16-1T3B]